jgi:hypothetical protein
MAVGSQTGQIVYKNLSGKKPFTKIGRVEWLKEESLSTNPSTAKKKKKKKKKAEMEETREGVMATVRF